MPHRLTILLFVGRIRDILWNWLWRQRPATRKVRWPAARTLHANGSLAGAHTRMPNQLQRPCTDAGRRPRRHPQGYKEVTDPQQAFYTRRIYGRIHVSPLRAARARAHA